MQNTGEGGGVPYCEVRTTREPSAFHKRRGIRCTNKPRPGRSCARCLQDKGSAFYVGCRRLVGLITCKRQSDTRVKEDSPPPATSTATTHHKFLPQSEATHPSVESHVGCGMCITARSLSVLSGETSGKPRRHSCQEPQTAFKYCGDSGTTLVGLWPDKPRQQARCGLIFEHKKSRIRPAPTDKLFVAREAPRKQNQPLTEQETQGSGRDVVEAVVSIRHPHVFMCLRGASL